MSERRPAAQYLRASTDRQCHSLEGQAVAIGAYAEAHDFVLVRTYQDAGKSGLNTQGRDGIKALLTDVLRGEAPFRTVLVLDVSRWGRYQDPDEAAHYEFLCRQAGVRIVYCAERFDDGISGSIVKQLKRVMAGEYSRELSHKVRSGKRRQFALGRPGGGATPYGFRRQVLNSDGSLGPILESGERKGRLDQRVRYVWGPAGEVANIRRIFRAYGREKLRTQEIVDGLNAAGRLWRDDKPWTTKRVWNVLRCELTIGYMVSNRRTSERLGASPQPRPRGEWLRCRVCRPMVELSLFRAAQQRRTDARTRAEAELLAALRRLLAERGRLSSSVLRETAWAPCPKSYFNHFGSLTNAYRLIGYDHRDASVARLKDGEGVGRGEVLNRLRALHRREGRINQQLIRRDPRLPPLRQLHRMFGDITLAYREAGLTLQRANQRPKSVQLAETK